MPSQPGKAPSNDLALNRSLAAKLVGSYEISHGARVPLSAYLRAHALLFYVLLTTSNSDLISQLLHTSSRLSSPTMEPWWGWIALSLYAASAWAHMCVQWAQLVRVDASDADKCLLVFLP